MYFFTNHVEQTALGVYRADAVFFDRIKTFYFLADLNLFSDYKINL
jgi:hypothetical protein